MAQGCVLACSCQGSTAKELNHESPRDSLAPFLGSMSLMEESVRAATLVAEDETGKGTFESAVKTLHEKMARCNGTFEQAFPEAAWLQKLQDMQQQRDSIIAERAKIYQKDAASIIDAIDACMKPLPKVANTEVAGLQAFVDAVTNATKDSELLAASDKAAGIIAAVGADSEAFRVGKLRILKDLAESCFGLVNVYSFFPSNSQL